MVNFDCIFASKADLQENQWYDNQICVRQCKELGEAFIGSVT